jgi:hypothetical protein
VHGLHCNLNFHGNINESVEEHWRYFEIASENESFLWCHGCVNASQSLTVFH